MLVACHDATPRDAGRLVPHPDVVAMVAARDGLSEGEAHAKVREVLLLVADAEARAPARTELTPERRTHLLRSAWARLWAQRVFEPRHRPDDIPREVIDPRRREPRYTHPRLHRLCQIVAIPPEDQPERAREAAWQAAAQERIDTVVRHFSPFVPAPEGSTCPRLPELLDLEPREENGVRLKFEGGGFDLDACSVEADDGTCTTPRWDAAWTRAVRAATPGTFIPPFASALGVHWVYLDAVLPARDGADPEIEQEIRAALHPKWQREAFARQLARMRADAAVQVVGAEP